MTCAECSKPIPAYDWGIRGFVAPTPPRPEASADQALPEEMVSVKVKTGPMGVTLTAVERVVCAGCYLTLFRAAHPPGTPEPRMPRLAEG